MVRLRGLKSFVERHPCVESEQLRLDAG
jgi:hypothetical protein